MKPEECGKQWLHSILRHYVSIYQKRLEKTMKILIASSFCSDMQYSLSHCGGGWGGTAMMTTTTQHYLAIE
jgi:hypothetical protein